LLWLPTDQALFDDPEFHQICEIYAENQEIFFEQYRQAHLKMSELGANFQFRIEMPMKQKVAEVKWETEEREVEEEKEEEEKEEGEEDDQGTEEEKSASKMENNKKQQQTEEEQSKKKETKDITPAVAEPKVEEVKQVEEKVRTVERMAGIASNGLPEEKEKEADERESLMRFSSARMYPPSDEEKSNYFDF
jgi:outer membrane biosynthesis protein TonB